MVRFKRHTSPWFDYLMVSPEEVHDVVNPSRGTSLKLSSRTNSRRAVSITLFCTEAESERCWGCLNVHGACSYDGGYIDSGCEHRNVEQPHATGPGEKRERAHCQSHDHVGGIVVEKPNEDDREEERKQQKPAANGERSNDFPRIECFETSVKAIV